MSKANYDELNLEDKVYEIADQRKNPKKIKDFSDGKPTIKLATMVLSVLGGFLLWMLIAETGLGGPLFAGPREVFGVALPELMSDGSNGTEAYLLLKHIQSSLGIVLSGWSLAFVVAIPIAFLMGWYRVFRNTTDPWIQFFRTIPPIALIPLVILLMGTGPESKVAVIFLTAFLVMVVTIYQGVRNMDQTMIKAAYTLGANDFSIFLKVAVPATFPFILVAARLGVSTALTTLIAAEMTGTFYGIGSMIQTSQIYMRMDKVILGILCIGLIGFILDRLLLVAEKKLTKWQ